MKKGFTLIELLAVIIILAIIALVATPKVIDVIDSYRESAAKDSAHGVLHSANYYYAEEYMNNNGSFKEYECSFNNGLGCDLLDIGGDKPTKGNISINKDGIVNGKIEFNDYAYYICNSKVLEEESSECSFIEYEKIYAINESGIITGLKTEDNVSMLNNIIPTVYATNITSEASEYIKDGKITIPEYVNNIEVTGIADNAFSGYEIKEVTILSSKVITIGTNAFPTTLTKLRVNSCLVDKYNLDAEVEGMGVCEIVTYKCKRATQLHAKGTTEYGSLGELGTLTSGDAFDCDVDGDETFDPTTERFYYVSDLYNTNTKGFDNKYAVLIYYKNTIKAGVYNVLGDAYDSYSNNYSGPRTARDHLPTTKQWSNVSLSNTSRAIITNGGSTSIGSKPLPTAFSYEGYATRFLTYQELVEGCGTDNLNNCNYLMENSQSLIKGLWLETPHAGGNAYVISHTSPSITTGITNYTNYGIRPVIEVKKTDIEI